MVSETEAIIGKRLRFYRMQRGISQTELGDHVGLTFQQVQKYEKGTNRVSVSRLVQFANFLEFSIEDFFDGLVDGEASGSRPLDEIRDALVEPHTIDLIRQFRHLDSNRAKKSVVDMLTAMNEDA